MPSEDTKVSTWFQPRYQSYWPWAGGLQAWKNDGGLSIRLEAMRKRISVNTPGYGKLKSRQLPNNPFTREMWDTVGGLWQRKTMFVYPTGVVAYNNHEGPAAYFGAGAELYANRHLISISDPSTSNKALQRVLDDVKLNKGSLLVGLAELGKTAEMIGSIATRVANAALALKKGQIKRFTAELGLKLHPSKIKRDRKMYVRVVNGVHYTRDQATRKWSRLSPDKASRNLEKRVQDFWTGKWLEYSYGVRPLLADVDNQMQNLAEYMVDQGLGQRIGKGSARVKLSKTTIDYPDSGALVRKLVVDQELRVKYQVVYKLDGDPTFMTKFGMKNLALVAWELVPFSFVADWGLPIGAWLESLLATDGLIFIKGSRTASLRTEVYNDIVSTGKKIGTNPYHYYTGEKIVGTNKHFYVYRTVLTSFPQLPFPEFKNPVSISHAISAIALLHAVFRK